MRLKIVLVALVVLLSQTLVMGLATAHDIDPAHASDDCAICLTVQHNDVAPPPVDAGLKFPPLAYWAVGDIASNDAVLKALSGTRKARAPPF